MMHAVKYLLLFFSFVLLVPCFAQTNETIEIATYYPAPYGAYAELTTTSNTSLATDTGGVVGIGTTNPQAKLEVAGGIKVGYDNGICDANKEGTMRWNTTISQMQYCDGASWGSSGGLFWFGDTAAFLRDGANSTATCNIPCVGPCTVPSLTVNAFSRVSGGVVQTRVTGTFTGLTGNDYCDSGWVNANSINCNVGPVNTYTGSVTAAAQAVGVSGIASRSDSQTCTSFGYWD